MPGRPEKVQPTSSAQEFTGISASAGYAEGPVFQLSAETTRYRPTGSISSEVAALQGAIEKASARLAELASRTSGEAADMLEFQFAMLADESLSGPAFASIEGGAPADQAWSDTLTNEIAGYEAAEDEYFRARAADLKDIRLQVLDRPGSAAAIATRMAQRNISLESIVQRHAGTGGDRSGRSGVPVPVVLITYATTEDAVRGALAAVMDDGHVAEPPQVIRIERGND